MAFAENSFILKNDGTLWGCGYNKRGTLGLVTDTSNKATFTQITTNADDIKSVHGGYDYTFILKNDDTLWGCGRNGDGELGLGDTSERSTFTQITDGVKSVYCGYEHTIILKNDNTLWGSGYNVYGQLGLGDTNNRYIFTKITGDVKSVCCGDGHTLILKNDGTLWGCGANDYGQLGLGDTTQRSIFTQIAINTDNIKSVCCGESYTLILKNDGTLWGCGVNGSGQLGLEDTNARTTFTMINSNPGNIKSIYCGLNHTLILQNDGTLYGCGDNSKGELGLEDISYSNIFTKITTNTSNIKCFANDYPIAPSVIKIYDTKIGYVETLDTNNFRNVPVDKFEKIKVLYANPNNTYLNCLISFDKKQTWKTFDGLNWNTISDISPENIILNGMDLKDIDQLDKNKLISGGLAGDLDFKIAMKTNNVKKTPSVTKIYIEYK